MPQKNKRPKTTGFDKQLVGAVASKLKTFRKIEPYKGKGVREKGNMYWKKRERKIMKLDTRKEKDLELALGEKSII